MSAMLEWLRQREYVIKARTICRMRGHAKSG
jgi:hypothetical protein